MRVYFGLGPFCRSPISRAALLAVILISAPSPASGGRIQEEQFEPQEPTLLVVTVRVVGAEEKTEQPLVEVFYGAGRLDYGHTDSRGEVRFELWSLGSHRVRVSLPGYQTVQDEIDVASHMRHQLFFELHPGGGDAAAPLGRPPSPEAIDRMVKARQSRADGDMTSAIQYMERAVELAPDFAGARMELGLYYWRTKRLEEARESLEKVRELNPLVVGAHIALSQVLSDMGRDIEAREVLLQASQSHPERAELVYALAKSYADAGELDQAKTVAVGGLDLDCSRVPHIHLLLAGIYAERNDLENELASVESYLAMAPPGSDLTRLRKRRDLLRLELEFKPSVDRYFAILEDYENGARDDALDRLALLPRGAVFRATERLGEYDDVQLLSAALMHTDAALTPGSDAGFHLSRASTCVGRIDDDSRREDLDRRWNLAMAYHFQRQHDFHVAVPFLSQLAKRYPDDLEVRLAYGSACEATGYLHEEFRDWLDTAEEQYRWILSSVPHHIEASLRLAHVLKLHGQTEESATLLESVLSSTTDSEQIFVADLLLGDIHRSQGRLPKAIEYYESALRIDPGSQAAAMALSHALHRARYLNRSTETLREFLRRDDRSHPATWWRYLAGHSDRAERLLLELRQELER